MNIHITFEMFKCFTKQIHKINFFLFNSDYF